jgi:hypothetical protein
MTVFSVASLFLPGTERIPDRPGVADFLAIMAIVLAFPLVGLVIAWKRPANLVGWLFLLTGVTMALNVFASEYSARAAFTGGALPGGQLVAWMAQSQWLLGPGVALPFAIAVFPDGHLPHSRWRPALAVSVVLSVVVTAVESFAPGDLVGYEGVFVNPFGWPGQLGQLAVLTAQVGGTLQLLPALVAITYTALRLRRARGAERQQLKWLVFPLVVFLATIAIAIAIAWSQPALADRVRWMFTVALAALAIVPVAAGIAVLRFRLYDIDVVIRRTIVYSAVVAILGASYLALVVALQSALTLLGGNDGLPVALSTLMIAAIFVPVRARARRIVDRRFYRSRYDAQRTVESFAGRLRDQVELEAVRQELSVAAGEAVRPASIGVWVRARGRP